MFRKEYCNCRCHDGVQIFCSCFIGCCHEPYTPKEKQTPKKKSSILRRLKYWWRLRRIGKFKKYKFPIIKGTVWPSLIAQDLITVQPMTKDPGVIFFKDSSVENKPEPEK